MTQRGQNRIDVKSQQGIVNRDVQFADRTPQAAAGASSL